MSASRHKKERPAGCVNIPLAAEPQTIPASPAKAPALCTKRGEPSTCLSIQ
jgi:hypothetical protein